MGEAEDLIDRELRDIVLQRSSGVRERIEHELKNLERELDAQNKLRIEDYAKALELQKKEAITRRRGALERSHNIYASEFGNIKKEFLNGYYDGWERIRQGNEISPSVILNFLPLGINTGNAVKFGLALGVLASLIENRPDTIFRNPKPYIGAMDLLKKDEYRGYREFILAKIRRIPSSKITADVRANYSYFMNKI